MATEVRDNIEASRFELVVEGELVGIADYRIDGDVVVMPHTEIDSRRRGRGLGARLVQGALERIRPTGRTVLPSCWYVAQFIDEHAEYADLLGTFGGAVGRGTPTT